MLLHKCEMFNLHLFLTLVNYGRTKQIEFTKEKLWEEKINLSALQSVCSEE